MRANSIGRSFFPSRTRAVFRISQRATLRMLQRSRMKMQPFQGSLRTDRIFQRAFSSLQTSFTE